VTGSPAQDKVESHKIRVLIVDDSASVRMTLSDIVASDPDLEVMATAADPYVAAEKIRAQIPDVSQSLRTADQRASR